jgi:transposase
MEVIWMGRALSIDLRERVLKAWRGGFSARGAAERFGVSASTAIRWVERARQGETQPRKTGRKHASALDAHEAFIVGLIEAQKDITLNEMVARLHDERSILVSRSGLNVWLRKHGFTYKKSPHTHWSRTVLTS